MVHNDAIVIADFGSVRRVDEATGRAPASKHSILYRPPEAFGNTAFFDFSSDVYQAGIIGYLLFGGSLSNDLLMHLSKKDLTKLDKVKKTGSDYEVSVFIDSCIGQKTRSGKLLDWNSIPFYVPKKVKRILKTAVSGHGERYQNVSEFLSELAKIKAGIPDWISSKGNYELRNWKGNDYLLEENKGQVILKKKKYTANTFRIDNSIKASSFAQAYDLLKKRLCLP